MHPTELNSHKLALESALRNSNASALNRILNEIASRETFPNSLLPLVSKALSKNLHLAAKTACSLLKSSKSLKLFKIIHTKKILGNYEYAELLEAHFPSPTIEKILCAALYDCFRIAGGSRIEIVNAMRAAGSTESLKTLEAIEYEFAPTIPERKFTLSDKRHHFPDNRVEMLES